METECEVCGKEIDVPNNGKFVCGGSCYLRYYPNHAMDIIVANLSR